MIWSDEEKQMIELYRDLIESDPAEAVKVITGGLSVNGNDSKVKIVLAILSIVGGKIYLEPDDYDIEVQYSFDGGNTVYVLMYVEPNGSIKNKKEVLSEFKYDLKNYYGFDNLLIEKLIKFVV